MIILVVVVLAVGAVVFFKKTACRQTAAPASSPRAQSGRQLPALCEFGAGKCVQCKNMAPIMASLAEEYEGALEVRSIDVYREKEITEKLHIIAIPCQVILDDKGKELFRHEGFIDKEALVKKLLELGVKPRGS
jgi:thioredoxin 1